jgi:hypothetical protein
VPAYSSAEMLSRLTVPDPTADPVSTVPHAVVRATDLARLLPPSVGIALNAGGTQSVPVYPPGVAYLASPEGGEAGDGISIGPLPAMPATLLTAVATALAAVPEVSEAAAAWLTVRFAGEGLVISVTLDDPGDASAQDAAIAAIERAASIAGSGEAEFPIDVTFPGEAEPDRIDDWFAGCGEAFYRR